MKIGVLGLGSAGKRHASNAEKLGHALISYDPDLDRKEQRQKVLDTADAVIIASPTEYHLQDLLDTMAAGKHALVEKPIALSRQRKAVQDLVELNAGATHPLVIAVGYNLRFHPLIKELKDLLASEARAGRKPHYADFICCQYTQSQDALTNGCLETWATHEIDLARHLIGELRLTDHHADHFQVELTLRRWEADWNSVHIHSDMKARQPMRQVTVVTERLTSRLDLERYPVTNEHYVAELQAFTSACVGIKSQILASGEDGVLALQIAERAQI